MGVSMCSNACNRSTNSLPEFQYTEELHTSDEWDISDDDQSFLPGRLGRSITMPAELRKIMDDTANIRRTKSAYSTRPRECAMREKMKDWHRSSVLNPEGELQARRYSKMVTDDSLEHLRHTIRTASSIVEKGTAINDELARQERVLSTAENDIAFAEYETDQTTQKLKGMKSLKGKLASVIWKKEPKLRINEFCQETSTFSNVNLDLLGDDVGLCGFSKMQNSTTSITEDTEDVQQAMINEGIGQLNKALDAIKVQQVDTAWALGKQEGRLSVFENRVSTTHQKINCQTQMIKSIMGK